MSEDLKVLRQCSLFKGITDKELEWIDQQMPKRSLKERETLFKQGDISKGAHIIVEGQLGVRTHILEDTNEKVPFTPVIATFGPSEVIGEFALVDSLPRSAEVFALEPSRVLTLEQEAVTMLTEVHPLIGYHIMRNLSEILVSRMRKTNERFVSALEWNWKQGGFDG